MSERTEFDKLCQWIAVADGDGIDTPHVTMLKAVRDEILALRERVAAERRVGDIWREHYQNAHAAALEEAARVCEGSGAIVREARLCAAAIRALKDNKEEPL